MNRLLALSLAAITLALPAAAARITNVKVDFVKGYAKDVAENGDTSYYYMGRATYSLFAEGSDSVTVNFKISPKGTESWLPIHQLTGDVGPVKQKNSGDTLKTIYFRAEVKKDLTGEYVGVVTAGVGMNRMWKMADSLGRLLSLDQREWSLYSAMSYDKVYHFFGQDSYRLPDNTFLAGWRCADGPHGTRYPLSDTKNEFAIYGAGDTATCFPTEAALGCTWDTELIHRVGQAIGKEARAFGVYCILGPMADLVTNPRWGRAFETMGEDPFHTGKMATSHIQGLQSVKVLGCPKHFGPYVTESARMSARIIVDDRAFRELFCEPFRMAVEEGNCRAIMTCYNRVRVPGFTVEDPNLISKKCDRAGSNRYIINTILRNDWGFDGIITTDWDGADGVDPAYSFETEFDLSMPQGAGGYYNSAAQVRAKIFSEETLNRKIQRLTYGKLWAWGGVLPASDEELKTYPKSTILCKEHKDLSLEAAQKSITLVKNEPVDGTPILPLNKKATLKISVIGPYADLPRPGGGGSSVVTPDKIVTLLQGMRDVAAANPNITLTTDYANADIAVVCVGVDRESEDFDRASMALPSSPINQDNLVATVMAKVKKTVVVYTGGSASVAGKWSEAPAIIVAFYPGRVQGQAMADVIFGDVNPAGHLNVTFPRTLSDLPPYDQKDLELKLASVDSAHGYFYFEKSGKQPLFWFGHGLSYTTFTFDAIRVVGSSTLAAGDRIDVMVTLTNTGTIDGADVVQLYVKPPAGSVPRRVKDLRGFARVHLKAKESVEIPFTLGPRDFSIYNSDPSTKTGKWEVAPGLYEIIAGSTSNPDALKGESGTSVKTSVTIN